MRAVAFAAGMVVVALLVALTFQVLVAQSREQGAFPDRVRTVLMRQFDFAAPASTNDAPSDANVRGAEPEFGPSSAARSLRLADMTVGDLETLIRVSTRQEMAELQRILSREADRRDRAGFWTDVRLNAFFLLLGLLGPVAVSRIARRA